MILTNKSKEDFERWLYSNDVLIKDGIYDDTYLIDVFDELPLNLQYAYIIDFFFSKNLHITEVLDGELNLKYVLTPVLEICFLKEQIISENTFSLDISLCKIEAIKKANEIYNTTL